jgi:acetyl-CoA C-acetyltransferase
MIKDAYLIGGARTAIGSFCGALESTPAPALGSAAVKAALARAALKPGDVDEVIFGNVIGAELG